MQEMEELKLPNIFEVSGYKVFFGQMKMMSLFIYMCARESLQKMQQKFGLLEQVEQ